VKKGDYAYYLNRLLSPTLVVINDVEENNGTRRYYVSHVRALGRRGSSWWCNESSLFPSLAEAEKRVREIIESRKVQH
jgi:hypothetical protein